MHKSDAVTRDLTSIINTKWSNETRIKHDPADILRAYRAWATSGDNPLTRLPLWFTYVDYRDNLELGTSKRIYETKPIPGYKFFLTNKKT